MAPAALADGADDGLAPPALPAALEEPYYDLAAQLEAAMEAGAHGGKINGSGGGGCMFAYAPNSAEEVAAAIDQAGGKAYIVHVDKGSEKDG